jgi:hypothetical protein
LSRVNYTALLQRDHVWPPDDLTRHDHIRATTVIGRVPRKVGIFPYLSKCVLLLRDRSKVRLIMIIDTVNQPYANDV